MIKVKRIDCPDILKTGLTPASQGQEETEDVIKFYSNAANRSAKYQKTGKRGHRINESYSVYSDTIVREALKKMFHGKCAYCESKITAIYSGDIEHFRPKGGYNNGAGQPLTTPGYYWLAADWNNLLFACPFCNQTNTHKISDNGKIEDFVQGKLNQFPLRIESFRLTTNHGSLFFSNEKIYNGAFDQEESQRLLLRPCTDENVELFFKYDDYGLILARDGLDNVGQKKAETSIRVYALQRLGLVQAREVRVIQIKAQIKRVEEAIDNLNNYIDSSEEERTWFEGILREEMQLLHRFMDPDQEYAGLARYTIQKYFNNFN
jgi:uncharacterized protein (TIGR02646 family)